MEKSDKLGGVSQIFVVETRLDTAKGDGGGEGEGDVGGGGAHDADTKSNA